MNVTPEQPKSDTSAILSVLKAEWLRKIVATYMFSEVTYRLVKKAYKDARSKVAYTVTVSSEEDIFPTLHQWLTDKIPERKLRSLTVYSKKEHKQDEVAPVEEGKPSRRFKRKKLLRFFYDGRSEAHVHINGHRIRVSLEQESLSDLDKYLLSDSNRTFRRQYKIVFTAFGTESQRAVLEFLSGMLDGLENDEESGPALFIATPYGSWRKRPDMGLRTLDTVILRDGLKEEIVADLSEFLDRQETYKRLGMPYHRGYLLEGPPGTGKTSLAKALAHHFALDVYYAPLSDLDRDTNLISMISEISPGSMLLIEDVDILNAASNRSDDQPHSITLSGLLNALDGVGTPSGLITVMTTNDVDDLDSALIRAGRIDRIDRIDYLDDAQFRSLVEVCIEQPTPGDIHLRHEKVTAADVAEVVKHYFDKPDDCLDALRDRFCVLPS